VFTSTHSNYAIHFRGTGSAAAEIRVRLRASGTDLSSNVYTYSGVASGASTVNIHQASVSFWAVSYVSGSGAYCDFNMWCSSPNLSERTRQITDGFRDDGYTQRTGGFVANTTSYDGFTVYPQSGTISGVIRVYGFSN
jgi:hypothetical protein